MPDDKKPLRPRPQEEPEIDYLVCRLCSSPCYVFQREEGNLIEAFCSVCGNDDVLLFTVSEEEDE